MTIIKHTTVSTFIKPCVDRVLRYITLFYYIYIIFLRYIKIIDWFVPQLFFLFIVKKKNWDFNQKKFI